VTLKTLVTGFVTGAAAAAVVAAAAAGVTSIAASGPISAPAIQPVVWDIPLPQAPAPELVSPLTQTLAGLAGPGSFGGPKKSYVEGGLGRIETITADRAFSKKAAEGYFPLTFAISDIDIDVDGRVATANVIATAATGTTASQAMTFVQGPSPSGWQVTKASALSLLSMAG
jgi:hypothetical protein